MESTTTLPSLPGLPWPGVEVPDGVLSINEIELNHALELN